MGICKLMLGDAVRCASLHTFAPNRIQSTAVSEQCDITLQVTNIKKKKKKKWCFLNICLPSVKDV